MSDGLTAADMAKVKLGVNECNKSRVVVSTIGRLNVPRSLRVILSVIAIVRRFVN